MKLHTLFVAAVAVGSTNIASANSETLSKCHVSIDFVIKPHRKLMDAEDGKKIEMLVAAVDGVGSQSAFCGPGTASSATEMRELTSFVASSKKLRNVRSNVAKSANGWLFFAEADSTAKDDVTPTRFEYQCRANATTKHLLCLTVGARKAGFPRADTDRFFESVQSVPPQR
jgi:hypothetical protein